jgi:hypothetical protein
MLARAHARSGDTGRHHRYRGRGRRFDEAVYAFAVSDATQTERERPALIAAVESGRVTVAVAN